ncbi:MAG: histidine phosphatase superfamily [Piptocephalis tieghemiana]|nr:MAG: histidine phosphatase superfamily [Piptocephalis tieghemiana]
MPSSLWSLLVLASAVQASVVVPHTPLVTLSASSQLNSTTTITTSSSLLPEDYDYCQAPMPNSNTYFPVPNATLHNLHEIFRHGDRTPTHVLDKDDGVWECGPSREVQKVVGSKGELVTESIILDYTIPATSPYSRDMWRGSCAPGQLTPKGIKQHHELGQHLRSIYVDKLGFLPSTLDPSALYLRTTDVWRTRQSLSSQLTGLYPPESRDNSSTTASAPLNVHIIHQPVDSLNDWRRQCDRFEAYKASARNATEFQAYWNQTSALRSYLKDTFSFSKAYPLPLGKNTVVPYMDAVVARVCHAMPLPCNPEKGNKCVTKDQARELLEAGSRENLLIHRTLPEAREANDLLAAPFLQEIRDKLGDVVHGRPAPKASLYSAHDSTLRFILASLDSTDKSWPPYASSLLVELWKKDGVVATGEDPWLVRLLYNGAPLQVSWCDFTHGCPLSTCEKYLNEHIPKDLEASCAL